MDDLFLAIGHRFGRVELRRRMRDYVRGLLAPVARKNSWQLAEQAGHSTPDGLQHLLAGSKWEPDDIRDDLQEYVAAKLGDADGVLIIDDTGFIKKGTTSAGVQRQYSGTAGRTENCQIGVFAAYASARGRALVDRELYLPKSWTEDRERCRTARIPDEREFATKGELARHMVLRALASPLPIAWVTADSAYGQDNRFRRLLEQSGVGYVLAVPKPQFSVGCSRIEGLFAQAPAEAWEKISCGDGAKGPRVYHWAAVRLPAVAEFDYQGEVPHRMRWALARRSISKPDEIAYYLAYAPLQVTVQELVRVAGARWAIEECFQAAKNECGLDQYEVRRYVGWHRHITLAMLAHAFLTAMAHQSWEKGAEQVGQPGSSGSQWRRFGDSWQLVVPSPRT
ncbi:IS701 family transposase [Streptomyces sp. IpFD-1.1]|uniref:IS701 family transposase n=1 Tax=Streptomyces sp. IpFD-1.1 TaxID=2841664 RepID=UPI000D72386B|nr:MULTISPECIES: IS701 family transposase [Streptomyces]MCO6748726.1 IS701 family transposase [Streptomyces sp. IpFD-1.1]QXQ28963.1 IS701 family transposase [Streptomyces albidoflavus]QXQ34891.1 IS701 family transposase [Streptomyces albidoflavus]WTB67171.1 IS701 family transposase [Streptomyces albidoflavus]